jgi:uncharacterized iron-regulated membrane protein
MKDSFIQSVDRLQTWGGLLFGWVLFAVFLTDALTVFDKEITYWMQPELHQIRTPPQPNIDTAAQNLSKLGGNSDHWWIGLPTTRVPVTKISGRPATSLKNG